MTCPDGAHTIEKWRGRDVCIECGIEPSKQTVVDLDHANHDPLCPSAYTFGICECALIATVREEERHIRWEEKRISFLEGYETAKKHFATKTLQPPADGRLAVQPTGVEAARESAYVAAVEALSPHFIEGGFCGFDPPHGWLELVLRLHKQLLHNPQYQIVQVKEKFGELRFYATGLTPDQCNLVRAAEQESRAVCQGCGSRENVEARNHGWVATLCVECDAGAPQDAAARGYTP